MIANIIPSFRAWAVRFFSDSESLSPTNTDEIIFTLFPTPTLMESKKPEKEKTIAMPETAVDPATILAAVLI